MAESPLLCLVRHGQTDSNVIGRFAGWSDDRLNERGRDQAAALTRRLSADGVDAVYTSPVRRAVETAEILGTFLDAPIRTVHGLHEIEIGPWSGLTEEEVRAGWPADYAVWQESPETFRLDGRETLAEVRERALRAIDQIGRDRLTASEAPAVVVSHLAVLRVLLMEARGLPLGEYHRVEADHCEVFPVRWPRRGTLVL